MSWKSCLALALSLCLASFAYAGEPVEIHDESTGETATVDLLGTKGAVTTQILDSGGIQIEDFGGTVTSVVASGQNTIASAGTAEVLAASTTTKSVALKALHGNSNMIYVGKSDVDSTNGFVLDAGEGLVLEVDNLTDIYIDADTSSDGVSYIAIN